MASLDTIPIVLSFTRNYLVPAATTIFSILKSNKSSKSYEFICLINEELPFVEQKKLVDFLNPNHSVRFLNLQHELNNLPVNSRFTIAASYRLLLPQILPNYNKVIYIDSDIIVKNDIGELYCTADLTNYYLAAVDEPALDLQLDYLEKIKCNPGEYFNSGFLIMNLELMRQHKLIPKFLEGLKNDSWLFPDQDILNIECKNYVLKIHPKYNSIRTFFLPQYKNDFLKRYSNKEWQEVQNDGNIHYTGAKPWNDFTVKFDEWWKHYYSIPKEIKENWKVNYKLYFLSRVWNIPPIKFVLESIIYLFRKIKYK